MAVPKSASASTAAGVTPCADPAPARMDTRAPSAKKVMGVFCFLVRGVAPQPEQGLVQDSGVWLLGVDAHGGHRVGEGSQDPSAWNASSVSITPGSLQGLFPARFDMRDGREPNHEPEKRTNRAGS